MAFVDSDGFTRRRTWTLIGHSMGEGFAGSSPMYKEHGHLAPFGPAGGAVSTPLAEWRVAKGLKMYMSDLPWPVGTGVPSPPVTVIGDGAWKDITLDVAFSPSHIHPYSPPYQYPSGRSVPYTPSAYRADGAGVPGLASSGGGGLCGVELPFAYGLSKYWGEEVYGVKLAIPSTYLIRFDAGSAGFSPYAWWTPRDRFDFDPTSGRLYDSMIAKMKGAQAALATSTERMDVRVSVLWLGDNDSALSTPRNIDFKDVYKNLIDKWRQACVDNNWTTLPKEQIQILMMGIYTTYGTPNRDDINAWLQEIEVEDPYTRYIATTGYESLLAAGYSDASHMSHNGYVAAALDMVDAIREMDVEPLDAMDVNELVPVSEVYSRVRTFYENNRVRTGAANDDTILVHLNGALTHIHSKISDRAYWLTKRESLPIAAAVGATETLPAKFHRVLRIESQNDPTQKLRFQEVGRAEGGRLQIVMLERANDTYMVHYIELPKELTVEDQIVPLPRVALEWLVTETCRRIARATQNVQLHLELRSEATELHKDVAKHCASMTRARNERLQVQKNLRGRIGTHYRRYRPWLNL